MDEIRIKKKEIKKEKPKFWKRKVGILGKQIPVVVLLMVLVGGLGGASLLLYFGQITTTANVQQAVTLLGSPTHTIPEEAPGGEEFCYLHKLDNKASVDIDVGITTECYRDNQWENNQHTCGGVTTTMYNISETRTLIFENKDASWKVINDNKQATLTFDPVSPTFDYELTATGLTPSIKYAIIYYADKPDRFVDWGGNNPGKLIDTFTADGSGSYIGSGNPDIGMNLPSEPDANINEYNYCILDGYVHCYGAKIWIVPMSDYTEPSLTAWNPSSYLFETDLIVYSDCNMTPENFAVDMERDINITTLTTKSRDKTPMLVCYDFDVAIAQGQYVITTGITPQ